MSSTTDLMEIAPVLENMESGTVVILATGGTIAGAGAAGKETGYEAGVVSVDSLVEDLPQLTAVAPIKALQFCNVNSDDITSTEWTELTCIINQLARDTRIRGFVITHGTDTMEETAYFLTLTLKTRKPVVITGSMRPSTAISADGPMNLFQSVCVAASPEAAGKGVLAVFSNHIYSARALAKTSTYDVTAISAGKMGTLGIVRNDSVHFYATPTKKHTLESEFFVGEDTALPRVNVVFFSVDADPDLLRYAADHSDGLVIAGAGAGEFSQKFIDVINGLTIPVVISSRIDDGIITQDSVLCPNTIAANNLSPQKATILLRLALLSHATHADLLRIFGEY